MTEARFRLQTRNEASGGKWIDVYCACSRYKVESILRLCAQKEGYDAKDYRIVEAEGREV